LTTTKSLKWFLPGREKLLAAAAMGSRGIVVKVLAAEGAQGVAGPRGQGSSFSRRLRRGLADHSLDVGLA
jgi:hypothetical protein